MFLQCHCEKIKYREQGRSTQAAGDLLTAGKLSSADQVQPSGALGLLTGPLSVERVIAVLRWVIDPELGVNIVDLGLVRNVAIDDGHVAIEMTLTTPGCPLGGFLDDEIRACLAQLPQVHDVSLALVWEPPWDPGQMTDEGRKQLGWL